MVNKSILALISVSIPIRAPSILGSWAARVPPVAYLAFTATFLLNQKRPPTNQPPPTKHPPQYNPSIQRRHGDQCRHNNPFSSRISNPQLQTRTRPKPRSALSPGRLDPANHPPPPQTKPDAALSSSAPSPRPRPFSYWSVLHSPPPPNTSPNFRARCARAETSVQTMSTSGIWRVAGTQPTVVRLRYTTT